MAKIDIETKITAPKIIEIPLVRADYASTSNIFRICFEVCLAIFSVLLGVVISKEGNDIESIYWVFLSVTFVGIIVFLILSCSFNKKSKIT